MGSEATIVFLTENDTACEPCWVFISTAGSLFIPPLWAARAFSRDKQRRDCILMSFGKDKMKIYPKEIGQIRQRLLCTKYIKGALNPNGTKSTGINKTIHQVSL